MLLVLPDVAPGTALTDMPRVCDCKCKQNIGHGLQYNEYETCSPKSAEREAPELRHAHAMHPMSALGACCAECERVNRLHTSLDWSRNPEYRHAKPHFPAMHLSSQQCFLRGASEHTAS